MKPRRGQAARIITEALHQLGRIAMLVVLLAMALFGLLAYRLSKGPMEIPHFASRVAMAFTGEGVNVRVAKAELAWAGYHKGGAVPLVLQLAGIEIRTDSGGVLADIPAADLSVPAADLFGGRQPVLMSGHGATFPGGNVPVSWYANLWPGSGYTLSHGAVYVTIGAGSIGRGENVVALDAASFVLAVAADGSVSVTNGMAQLAQRGQSAPRLTFGFRAHRDELWFGRLEVKLDAARAQDLPAFWPPAVLPDTRRWVTSNITGGTARDARFVFDLASNGDLSHARIENAHGQFDGNDLTLTWLRGAAPIEHLNGVFAMPGLDTAVITASGGETGGVSLKSGSLIITGLAAKDQFGDLTLSLSGRLQDVLKILGAPPLNLLDTTPPEIRNATGQAQGTVNATIPFKKNLELADVGLNVQANLTAVRMDTLIPGVGFSGGHVALATDGNTLHASAEAEFAGEPANVTVEQNLSEKNGSEILSIKGTAGPLLWQAFGLDTPSNVSSAAQGSAPFTFTLSGPPAGVQQAEVKADLTPVGLALPILGWAKTPGSAGRLSARFTLRDGALADIESLNMQAPELTVRGHSQGNVFTVEEARIGRSEASGTLTAPATPGAAWVLRADGTALDLRQGAWKGKGGKKTQEINRQASAPAASGPLWQASLAFENVYISKPPAPGLTDVRLTASGRGYDLREAQGAAAGVDVTVAPLSAARRSLAVQGGDAGALLRSMGAYDGIRGGTLDLRAEYGGGPAKGTVKLAKIRLIDAPGFTKVLQAATLYGVAEAVSGPGLLIDHATIPFTLNGNTLTLQGADAYSESLGFTASGTVNTETGICDFDTTIVPAYAINALPGKIPLLGHLFSAEKGGGLFAMRAHVQGPMDSPAVRVNPLSALTPGFLRGIFGLGEARPQNEASAPAK